MKKVLLILCLTLAVAVMAACDSGPGDTGSAISEPVPEASEAVSRTETVHTATGYIFTANGESFGVGDLSEPVVEKLGRPSMKKRVDFVGRVLFHITGKRIACF